MLVDTAENEAFDLGRLDRERQKKNHVFGRLVSDIYLLYKPTLFIVEPFTLLTLIIFIMRLFLLCLFVSLSVPNPLPEDLPDQPDTTNLGTVNLKTPNIVSKGPSYANEIAITSPDIVEFEVSSNLNDATSSNGGTLCRRGPVDVDDQSQSSGPYDIAQTPSYCPADPKIGRNGAAGNTVKPGSEVGRNRDTHYDPRPDIKCPETKRGEPSYYKLCCSDSHESSQSGQKPTDTPRRDIHKRDTRGRNNCVNCMDLLPTHLFFHNPPDI